MLKVKKAIHSCFQRPISHKISWISAFSTFSRRLSLHANSSEMLPFLPSLASCWAHTAQEGFTYPISESMFSPCPIIQNNGGLIFLSTLWLRVLLVGTFLRCPVKLWKFPFKLVERHHLGATRRNYKTTKIDTEKGKLDIRICQYHALETPSINPY